VTTLTYLYDELGRASALTAQVATDPTVYCLAITVSDRGDVLALSDIVAARTSARGVVAGWEYDAWGNPTATASAGTTIVPAAVAAAVAAAQPLRYAGYAYDAFSGLYYCSQRYYDPVTCQWISADPANADGEESSYQYCSGDPVGGTDPSGLYAHKMLSVKNYPAQYVCWAGCVHVIMGYIYAWIPESTLIYDVFPKWNGKYPGPGAKPDKVEQVFADYGYTDSYQASPLSWKALKTEINASRPIYMDLNAKKGGHAEVIKGFSEKDGKQRVFIMDPYDGLGHEFFYSQLTKGCVQKESGVSLKWVATIFDIVH
jgi:RHS repeat-associated protein